MIDQIEIDYFSSTDVSFHHYDALNQSLPSSKISASNKFGAVHREFANPFTVALYILCNFANALLTYQIGLA